MDMESLQLFWFFAIGFFLTGYAILDGFDLGVGIMHLLVTRTDEERRLSMNAIGPLWDGNEVWLVVFGGALFAAFPEAYATVFSGFYLPFMLLLCAIIFRAVSLEFRSKSPRRGWRLAWDVGFAASSTTAALLFGVAVGNTMRGIPIDARLIFRGGLMDLLHPYALLVGALVVALFAMHGAIYLHLKVEGELHERLVPWMWRMFGIFLVLYLITTIATLQSVPTATANFERYPASWLIVALNILAVANIPRAIYQGRPGYAFVSSSATIAALAMLLGVALFPNLVITTLASGKNITIYNASSSEGTLRIMRNIAFLGGPLVATYTAIIYWVFRGKVQLDGSSY